MERGFFTPVSGKEIMPQDKPSSETSTRRLILLPENFLTLEDAMSRYDSQHTRINTIK